MKTDKISFGTKGKIGLTSAILGLPKYNQRVTSGIYDAFEQLSKNSSDDELSLIIGPANGSKNKALDKLQLDYWTKNGSMYQSSKSFDIKKLEKFSTKKITKLILDTYEFLKTSKTKVDFIKEYPLARQLKLFVSKKQHQDKINILTEKYGANDWTCG